MRFGVRNCQFCYQRTWVNFITRILALFGLIICVRNIIEPLSIYTKVSKSVRKIVKHETGGLKYVSPREELMVLNGTTSLIPTVKIDGSLMKTNKAMHKKHNYNSINVRQKYDKKIQSITRTINSTIDKEQERKRKVQHLTQMLKKMYNWKKNTFKNADVIQQAIKEVVEETGEKVHDSKKLPGINFRHKVKGQASKLQHHITGGIRNLTLPDAYIIGVHECKSGKFEYIFCRLNSTVSAISKVDLT